MFPIVCAGCNELLDRDAAICRSCGEDNRIDAPEPEYEVPAEVDLDKLQPWSAVKHEIIEKYAHAYTTILQTQSWARRYVYIDAFAGAGVAEDPNDRDVLYHAGALRVLNVEPHFSEYHFIELNRDKANVLRGLTKDRRDVTVHVGDYRDVLPGLLARCRFEDYARALCLLDPYGLRVDYELLKSIADTNTVEIFFNFMLVAANRNALWRNPDRISPQRGEMMTRCWPTWRHDVYEKQAGLFGDVFAKRSNEAVAVAYRTKLLEAGFNYVAKPIAMRNRLNAAIYYLYFCSPKAVAAGIVNEIFSKYR